MERQTYTNTNRYLFLFLIALMVSCSKSDVQIAKSLNKEIAIYPDKTTKDDLVNNVINNLKDGGIINMHSVHDKTAEAVPEILEQCKDKGYQVVGVSELFAIKGKKLMTGVKYNNAE